MGDIKQGRSYKDTILNFSKRLYKQSLKKKFGTHVEKSMVFKILKKKTKKHKKHSVSFLEIKLFVETPVEEGWVKNLILPKSYRFHNPKTWKHIDEIFGLQSETSLLINCGKVSSLPNKK